MKTMSKELRTFLLKAAEEGMYDKSELAKLLSGREIEFEVITSPECVGCTREGAVEYEEQEGNMVKVSDEWKRKVILAVSLNNPLDLDDGSVSVKKIKSREACKNCKERKS